MIQFFLYTGCERNEAKLGKNSPEKLRYVLGCDKDHTMILSSAFSFVTFNGRLEEDWLPFLLTGVSQTEKLVGCLYNLKHIAF